MKIYPVFIPHAGCPHRCLFCAQDRSTNHADVPSAETVGRWLETVLPELGAGEVAFYGGTFTSLPEEQQALYLDTATSHISSGRVSGIRISTRPDALDTRTLARLRDAGVTTVEIGCQSFDNAVLAASGRGHTALDNLSSVQACLSAGFRVGVQLMPGLPGGDGEEAMRSLQRAIDLKPSFLRIYPTVVVEGTELAELWRAGDFTPWSLDQAIDLCADMLLLCRKYAVPIIRLGLQSDPQLEENLLDGPYHPAFGQLVRSRLWRRALSHAGRYGNNFTVHPSDMSDALGHRGENREWLKQADPHIIISADQSVARESLRASGVALQLFDLNVQGGH
ncbi:MAG: radical SAM protein [Deltaproteobacteria bacterium]|nr:MAG: radical SAM protein [Deltaproteobacteria bacterium]